MLGRDGASGSLLRIQAMPSGYYPCTLNEQGSGYRLYRLTDRPCAIIRDAGGLDADCTAYLLFGSCASTDIGAD